MDDHQPSANVLHQTARHCLRHQPLATKREAIGTKLPTIGDLLTIWKQRQELEHKEKAQRFQTQTSVTISFNAPTTEQGRRRPLPSLQRDVYEFLHRPNSWFAYAYHLLVFLIVFVGLFVTVFLTIKKFENYFSQLMLDMEKVIIVWFTGEFLIRLWASSCWPGYRGWMGKFRYLCCPAHAIDLVVIAVSMSVMLIQSSREANIVFAASAFRGFHRFFQVIRMIRTERRFTPFRVLLSVLYAQREQLIVISYIAFLVLSFAAFLLYLAEKDSNEQFESIADAFWWAVVSLFTIGYGDKVPITWLGKLIGTFFIIFGVSLFAIPAGILGAGLAINIKQQQKTLQNKKKQIPAACLIQCSWRFYATKDRSLASSSWNQCQVYGSVGETKRNAIRFIRILKFRTALRAFRHVLDHKDVHHIIEQNRMDHLTINYKINELKSSVQEIQTKFDSNMNRISYQLTRMERLTRDLNHKMDNKVNDQGVNGHTSCSFGSSNSF